MGYYAYGYGGFSHDKDEDLDKFLETTPYKNMDELFDSIKELYGVEIGESTIYGNDTVEYDAVMEYTSYHSEDIEEMLGILAPIMEGYLALTGDDDAHWKYVLKNGTFEEFCGDIVYEDEMPNEKINAIREVLKEGCTPEEAIEKIRQIVEGGDL